MRRLRFIFSGAALAVAPWFGASPVHAQSADGRAGRNRKARIGYVSWFSTASNINLELFRKGMREIGHEEGKTYELEVTFAGGDPALAQAAIRKLVETPPVDVLVVSATPVAKAAKQATQTVPIVMLTSNALAAGLVSSLARPGGNITGVSLLLTDLSGKRLEMLREFMPKLKKVAFIGSAQDQNGPVFLSELETAATRNRIEVLSRMVNSPQDITQGLFDSLRQQGAQAVFVQPIFTGYQDRIVPMATNAKLPVVSDWSAFAEAGALFTHSASQSAANHRMAYFVDRILKGAKPEDLPVEQPTELELVVNRKAARQWGLTIPQSVLLRSTRVID